MTGKEKSLLEIENLTVGYRHGDEWLEAVRNVSFNIESGQTYGLVGESGSGKTTLALALMHYLPSDGQVRQGHIRFDGVDLLALDHEAMRPFWGASMALVPQNPGASLNPSLKVGEQIEEILRHHLDVSPAESSQRTSDLLDKVRIPDPERVRDAYPHQLSGGMQQRVVIAMALSVDPKLLVLDEPTTNLDATTQAAVLDLIRDLMHEHRGAALYVTHNLGVVAQICDQVAVLYAGELLEEGSTESIYRTPLHPYTEGLLDSVPRLGENKERVQLRPIQGSIPQLDNLPSGCIFRPRCPIAIEICEEHPPLFDISAAHVSRCFRWEEIRDGELDPLQPILAQKPRSREGNSANVLWVDDLEVSYPGAGRTGEEVRAVDGISLTVGAGQTVGLVGESGSGKTSLARAIVGLVPRSGGEIELLDLPLAPSVDDRNLETLRHLQIVFQNPEEALNPYLSVRQTLRRPLLRLADMSRRSVDREVGRLLTAVHLPASYADRMPNQLSGGEKQRVAIARAFASNPDLLIADEPVSSLDVSVQASILNLLNELQSEHDSAYLFISHDLSVVGYLADLVAVVYLGCLMEVSPARQLFEPPYHPYTESLLSAIPLIDPNAKQRQIRLEGEIPSPVDRPSGCPFHTRCPRFLGNICEEEEPPWRTTASGARYYCHISEEDLLAVQKRVFSFDRLRREQTE